VASKGRSVGESIKGARSNYFLLNKESAWLSPYLPRQLSVFCHLMSEFIRVSCCSRKKMVASKNTRNYTDFSQSPTSSLKDSLSVCYLVKCSEVLTTGYARREKEVGDVDGH
jgi:hypothetical protein